MKITTIVVHGMLDHAYQQEVIVEGCKYQPEDLQVLFNIRKHLSIQYGNNTPLAGWAIQPSPSGRWLDYIERTFDKDYQPAYIVFSTFIPFGMNLNVNAIQKIENVLTQNHHRYVANNVILDNPDWSFLFRMADAVDSSLAETASGDTLGWVMPAQRAAYYPDTIHEMVEHLWDEKFINFRIVYCGKRILNDETNIPSTEQRLLSSGHPKTPSQPRGKDENPHNTTKNSHSNYHSNAHKKQEGRNDDRHKKPYWKRIPVIVTAAIVLLLGIVFCVIMVQKNPLDGLTAQMHDCLDQLSSEFSGRDSQRYYGDNHYQDLKQLNADYLSNGGELQDPFYKEFKSLLDKQSELRHDDSIFMSAMHEYKETGFQAAVISTLNISDTVKLSREHSAEVQVIFSERDDYLGAEEERKKGELQKQEENSLYKKCIGANATVNLCRQYLKTYPHGVHVNEVKNRLTKLQESTSKASTSNATSSTVAEPTKQKITTVSHLFNTLTWDNVKDNGKKFYEKFEMVNRSLKYRVKVIIERANQIGRARYEEARKAAPDLRESDGRKNDILTCFEKLLGI